MKSLVLLLCVMAFTSCKPCHLMLCISFVTVALGDTERAIFDEGETAVQLCINESCLDFMVPAGSAAVGIDEPLRAQMDFAADQKLLFEIFEGLHNEGARNVKLVISREGTERVNRSWSAVPFDFISDQNDSCSQSCVQASVSTN